jgi:hypothetical protein
MAEGDFLKAVVPETELNSNFKVLRDSLSHEAHREVLRELWARFPNPDGGFIREFQTEHFDRRIWELYIFALGSAGPFTVSRPHHAPDFLFEREGVEIWIEATTANPSTANPLKSGKKTAEELIAEANEEVPIRLGSSLYSKLRARYWELPHVSGRPLVLAIGDFSQGAGPRHSDFPLVRYLFGQDAKVVSMPGESVRLETVKVETHSAWKTIPSGFFNLPEAENVSAVLFSNEGTLPKFGRMGFSFGRHTSVRMWRVGTCIDFDPRATYPSAFGYLVGDAPEEWAHGAYLYHNPNAKFPIPLDVFRGPDARRGIGGQHWVAEGALHNALRDFSPMCSMTFIAQSSDGKPFSPAADDGLRELVRQQTDDLERSNREMVGFHAWRDKLIRPSS